jgi:hypothetical protein
MDHARTHQGRPDRVRVLITRFVDPDATFLFVPERELMATAQREQATPFDAKGLATVTLDHRGKRCTCEAILEDFELNEPPLRRLGLIVRAADVKAQEHVAPEGAGLRAFADGFAAMGLSDRERLRAGFPVYDALYAYVRSR